MTERRAEEATRVVSSWLKAFYMSDKVGQCFDGVVVHVVEFGLFVSIPDMQIEGLLHISDLPGDHYEHDAATLSLLGRYHRRSFRLGDAVQVRVAHVDLDEAKITFDWHDG